jgi:hypothetical protein
MMQRSRALLVPLMLAAVAQGVTAREVRADARDSAAAQALFDEAQRLVGSGEYARACPKYEDSERLDPALGTAYNLADCYEHVGRTASAWALFLEVESGAKSAGKRARETAAHERATSLEPRLSRLTIVVPEAVRTAGLIVKRDGTGVGAGSWGEALPIDPGAHAVDAAAPGKTSWHADVMVGTEGARAAVTVPALADAATAVAAPTATPSTTPAPPVSTASPSENVDASGSASSTSAQRTWALVVGGVGVVGVGVGTVFGARSIAKHDEAAKTCASPNPCGDRQAATAWSDATSAGTVSTLALGIGAAAVAAGIVLWLTSPKAGARVQTVPSVGAHGAGLVVRGLW